MYERGFLKRMRGDTGGNVLAIAAAAMIPFTIMVGSALDLSVTYMARSKLQNACDAGALAARQSMTGVDFTKEVEDEGDTFFTFNFPTGTAGTTNVVFELEQDEDNGSQLNGVASAQVPTSLINIIGIDHLDISVNCDATRDMGHNDIMLVLDVTGSMNCAPGVAGGCGGVEQTGAKIQRLRDGASGLYKAMQSGDGSLVRFGIMPYSHTVNVGRSLEDPDILKVQNYLTGNWTYERCESNGSVYWGCVAMTSSTRPAIGLTEGNTKYHRLVTFNKTGETGVDIKDSTWGTLGGNSTGNRQGFRTSGNACIEERPTIDPTNPAAAGTFVIRDYVTLDDINATRKNDNDTARQFGRYDPAVQKGFTQDGCPAEATRLTKYDDEDDFDDAIDLATSRVTGGTYHDLGMLWGTRFVSRDGFFKGNSVTAGYNAKTHLGYPVNTHIVFMTDGILDTGDTLYSADGVQKYQLHQQGTGTLNQKHVARFKSVCNLAKGMGVTVWVIALDVPETDTADIESCATSGEHFYVSDGTDLYNIFVEIGRGIGNLRLTR